MKFEIKHWITGSLLFECDAESLLLAVVEAVKGGAYLQCADLGGANLRGAKGVTPQVLQILGSRHTLIVREYGKVQIGCHSHALEQWEENCEKIGKAEGYSEEQIEEYREHIASARKFMERYKLLEAPKEESVMATK